MNKPSIRDIYGIDKECVALCESINKLKGVYTTESCCGHGKTPYHIFFKVLTLEALKSLVYNIDFTITGLKGWKIIALTDSAMCPVYFLLEGPIGRPAYFESLTLSKRINKFLEINKKYAE